MKEMRIPLVGSIVYRSNDNAGTNVERQYFKNCFPTIKQNPITGAKKLYLVRRPSINSGTVTGANFVGDMGACIWTLTSPRATFSYYNTGTSKVEVYWMSGGSGTLIGASIANANRCFGLSDTRISNVPTLLAHCNYTVDSYRHYWWIADGGVAWTRITDVDFPPNQTPQIYLMGNAVHMDGYMFVMDINGRIWNSDLNSVINWTATGFVDAQSFPDSGRDLARSRSLIVAFLSKHIEFFQNTGNATGSPLSRVQGMTIPIGLTSGFGQVRTIGDDIYFLGVPSASGNLGVYKLSGTTVTKISSLDVDSVLNLYAGGSCTLAGSLALDGMNHLIVSFSTGFGFRNQLAYCIDTGFWWELEIATTTNIAAAVSEGGVPYFTSSTAAQGQKVFYNNTYPQSTTGIDEGVASTMEVKTLPIDWGTHKRKYCKKLAIVAPLLEAISGTNDISVSYSDDSGVTFSTAKTINLSASPPLYPRLHRLGSYRQRVWKLTKNDTNPFAAEALEETVEVANV